MTAFVVSLQPAPEPVAEASTRWHAPFRVLALLPLWIFLIFNLAQGTSMGGPMGEPPTILGFPLYGWLAILAGAWTLAGLALIWDARSTLRRTVALLVFTIPATFVLILGPALILILQNLG